MPIRIYALAKDLKIDSKELVEVCTKAGITGKGSALASLTDDEVEKVKSYLQGGKKPESGRLPSRPAPPGPAGSRPASRGDYIGPAGRRQRPRTPIVSADPSKPSGSAEARKPPKRPLKKDPSYVSPPFPRHPRRPRRRRADEPAPQKPIMTLPADAIRNAKSGSRAPLEQFTRQQDKKRDRRATARNQRGKTAPGPTEPATRADARP